MPEKEEQQNFEFIKKMHACLDIKMDKIMRIPYPSIVIEKYVLKEEAQH